MIVYLLKFIACSGLLILFYYGVLQNERLFKFSRFFLLSIVALALIIPVTVVRTKVIKTPIVHEATFVPEQDQLTTENYTPPASYSEVEASTPLITLKHVLWSLYGIVALFLLIRFAHSLFTILRLRRGGQLVHAHGIKIILRTNITASFSFLNCMYTNTTRFEQGNLPIEIILHEKHHIVQKHSYDIIFIELMQCLFWFNPFVYMIKKAIKLNHEFLADQHVLKDKTSAYEYQRVLLGFTKKQHIQTPAFASNLNYGFTKKRLNMMTKNTNRLKSMTKQVAAYGVIAFTFWMGGETRAIAQEKEDIIDLNVTMDLEPVIANYPERSIDLNVTIGQQDTLKQKLLKPYSLVYTLVRFKGKDGKLVQGNYQEFTKEQKAQFLEAAANSGVEFFVPPPPKAEIDQALLDEFKDAEKYGVWVDGKRVTSDQLSKYSPSDFHHFNKSALLKGSKDYGKYTFHLSLTTNDYFESKDNLNGRWLPLKNRTLSEIPTQKKKDEKPREFSYVRIPAPPVMLSQVRFKDKQGNMILKQYSELSDDEIFRFREKASGGQFFVPPTPKSVIDEEVIDDLLNPKKYGIWVDGQHIANEKLKAYSPEDFHHYIKSKLYGRAKAGKIYDYQIGLITNNHFNAQPESEGKWVDYKYQKPRIVEVKPKQKNKDKEPKDKLKDKPLIKEVKSGNLRE